MHENPEMTRTPLRLTGLLLALSQLLAACTGAPARPSALAVGDDAAVVRHMEAWLAHRMRSEGITGLSIAVVDGPRVVWAHGAGLADASARLPATPDTVYRMGSITKLFTATAAMRLAEAGRLDPDAPFTDALPALQMRDRHAGGAPVAFTARQLMSHHAGLPRDLAGGMWGDTVAPMHSVLPTLASIDTAYPAGQVFSYSNIGFTLLGLAVEQVSGEHYATHLERTLLSPLGMHTASFTAALPDNAARAHRDGRVVPEPALRDVAAGGLNASVLDMSRFMIAALDPEDRLLPQAAHGAMQQAQNAGNPLDLDLRMGLGWLLNMPGSDSPGSAGPLIQHDGATLHFSSRLIALPAQRLGVIVASNSAGAGPTVHAAAAYALELFLEARKGLRATSPVGFTAREQPWQPEELAQWPGDYSTLAGHVRVSRDGQRLHADMAGTRFELIPDSQGRAGLRYRLLGLVPVPIGRFGEIALERRQISGREVLVAHAEGGALLAGERMRPEGSDPGPSLTGRYRPQAGTPEAALIDHVEVYEDAGVLLSRSVLHAAGGSDVPAVPLRRLDARRVEVLGVLASGGEVAELSEDGRQVRYSGMTLERAQ